MTPERPPSPLLTVSEAAAYLRVTTRSLQQHWRKWNIPAYKVNAELRFTEADLAEWLTQHARIEASA